MMMLVVYNVYNSAATIRESLKSVLPYVAGVIAVDGAYEKFPHEAESGASDDGTREIFQELCGSKLTWVDQKEPMSQVDKKNCVLNQVPRGSWFFRIAGDEVVRGDVAEAFRFAESSNFLNIGVPLKNFLPVWDGYNIQKAGGHAYIDLFKTIPEDRWHTLRWKPYYGVANRIVFRQKGLHFKHHHSTMFRGRKPMRIQTKVDNILIINQPQKTGWKRWHDKIEYKKRRYEEGDYEG